jgi:thymidine kinase
MPKLYFRYGAMNSSKTANLLMVAHNYTTNGKKVLLLKPEIDTRFGANIINSRVGIKHDVHEIIKEDTDIIAFIKKHSITETDCVLVDECQFLTAKNIDQLRIITKTVPVICYGLRTDYKLQLFSGSKRLFEIADVIEEVKTVCIKCNKKAIVNAKFYINNDNVQKLIKDGTNEPDLGAEDKYQPMCWQCFEKN